MEVFRYKTRKEASFQAGQYISGLVEDMRGKSLLLLLSGGSCFEVADVIDPAVLGSYVTIGMLDERYSLDPSINNFAQLASHTLYKEAQRQGVRFIDTRVRLRIVNKNEIPETFEEFTIRMDKGFREWKSANPAGRVVITQGVGQDGHTAGIMPYTLQREKFESLFEDSKKWVVGYDAQATSKKTRDSSLKVEKQKLRKSPRSLKPFAGDHLIFRGNSPLFGGNDPLVGAVKSLWSSRLSTAGGVFPLRVTLTLPFLREMVDYSVVYVVGREKRAVLDRVLLEKTRLWEIPGRIIHEMKHISLFTDIT